MLLSLTINGKSRILIIALLCLSGHTNFTSAQKPGNENYMSYHQGIIRCEEQFLYHNSIRKALNGYRELFNEYRKPFAKDCFIALQLVCSIADTANAEYFFLRAFERGVNWTAVETAPAIKSFFETRQGYKEAMLAQYPEYRKKWLGSINNTVRLQITALRKRDVAAKLRTNHLERNSDEEYTAIDQYNRVLDSNAVDIVKLTKRYGFLGDNVIGFYEGLKADSGILDKDDCYSISSIIDNQFFHHHCLYFLLKTEMDTALANGEISPAMYAMIYEWAYSELERKPTGIRIHPRSKLCVPKPEKRTSFYKIAPLFSSVMMDDTEQINRDRARIGLPSVAHTRKKRAYEKEEKIRLFFGTFSTY